MPLRLLRTGPLRLLCAGALGCALVAIGGRVVASGHLLLTSDLKLLRGQVTRIGPSSVAYRDASGQDIFIPAERCLGVIALSSIDSGRRDAAVLHLADGQRVPGRPEVRQGRLFLNNPLLGGVRVDLDAVQGLSLRPGLEPPVAEELDVLLLSNGDRVEGVVESIEAELVLSLQGGGSELEEGEAMRIPLERIEAVGLVTPRRRAGGCRVWLADGTVADVERPIAEGDGVVHLRGFLESAETRAQGLPLDYVRGIRFSQERFVPLASLSPRRVSAPIERLQATPPVIEDRLAPLELSAIRLSGPVEVEWALPSSMRRLVARVLVPSAVRSWTDLELVVLDGAGEVLRRRITAATSGVEIDAALRDGTLILRLEEGQRGPIGDTIILETPVLGPAAESSGAASSSSH